MSDQAVSGSTNSVNMVDRISRTPMEVLVMICDLVDAEDLVNTRLASKKFSAASTEHFAKKKFSRRRFVLSEFAMTAMVNLTNHPQFAPHIQSLSLGTVQIPNRHEKVMDAIEEAENTSDEEKTNIFSICSSRGKKQAVFLEGGGLLNMLSQSLRNLQRLGNNSVALGIYSDLSWSQVYDSTPFESRWLKGHGCDRLFNSIPLSLMERNQRWTMQKLHEATKATSYAIQNFSLDTTDDISVLLISDPNEINFSSFVLGNNDHLKPGIDFNIIYAPWMEMSFSSTHSRFGVRSAYHHHSLLRRGENPFVAREFIQSKLGYAIFPSKFKRLYLESTQFDIACLHLLLTETRGSLESMKLIDVDLKWRGHSRRTRQSILSLLDNMKQLQKLDELVLKDIECNWMKIQYRSSDWMIKPWVVGRKCWKGAAEVWKGAAEVLQGIESLIADLHLWNEEDGKKVNWIPKNYTPAEMEKVYSQSINTLRDLDIERKWDEIDEE